MLKNILLYKISYGLSFVFCHLKTTNVPPLPRGCPSQTLWGELGKLRVRGLVWKMFKSRGPMCQTFGDGIP